MTLTYAIVSFKYILPTMYTLNNAQCLNLRQKLIIHVILAQPFTFRISDKKYSVQRIHFCVRRQRRLVQNIMAERVGYDEIFLLKKFNCWVALTTPTRFTCTYTHHSVWASYLGHWPRYVRNFADPKICSNEAQSSCWPLHKISHSYTLVRVTAAIAGVSWSSLLSNTKTMCKSLYNHLGGANKRLELHGKSPLTSVEKILDYKLSFESLKSWVCRFCAYAT